MTVRALEADIPRARAASPRRWFANMRVLELQIAVIVATVGIWQLLGSTHVVDTFYISSPVAVLKRLWSFRESVGQPGSALTIWDNIGTTMAEALYGFALGTAVGILIGFFLGQFRIVGQAVEPLLNLANTLPRVALGPLFILWFGLGEASKTSLVFTVVVFIMIFNTQAGTQNVDEDLIAATRLLGANRLQLTWKITFPSCLPWIFAGARTAIAWSLGGAVIGEYLGSQAGVGYLIFYYANALDNTGLIAGCVVLLLMSFVMFTVLNLVERFVVPDARRR